MDDRNQLTNLYNSIAAYEKLSAYAPALLRVIQRWDHTDSPQCVCTECVQNRWLSHSANPQSSTGE